MECDWGNFPPYADPLDFNQRTRMECDGDKAVNCIVNFVFQSTYSHGVRLADLYVWNRDIGISINALVWSATWLAFINFNCCNNFNQRTRMECDRLEHFNSHTREDFNQRTRMECDRSSTAFSVRSATFQSTHSCGVRRCERSQCVFISTFQSTHSYGVRPPHRFLWEGRQSF